MINNTTYKLIVFDMDGTLLQDRTIFVFADLYGFTEEMNAILYSSTPSYQKNQQIAKLLKGKTKQELLNQFCKIPLSPHIETVMNYLHSKKITTAIATASYDFLAQNLKQRLNFDFAFANNLLFDQGIVTGELNVHNINYEDCGEGIQYSICKGMVIRHLCEILHIQPEETIAVGDGQIDISMFTTAGLSIAYNAPQEVQRHAKHAINNMHDILKFI